MGKIYRLGYRIKGKKTWKPITVYLGKKALKRTRAIYHGIPKEQLGFYNIPSEAIFYAKQVKRIRRFI
jgi:hypothetical protein